MGATVSASSAQSTRSSGAVGGAVRGPRAVGSRVGAGVSLAKVGDDVVRFDASVAWVGAALGAAVFSAQDGLVVGATVPGCVGSNVGALVSKLVVCAVDARVGDSVGGDVSGGSVGEASWREVG